MKRTKNRLISVKVEKTILLIMCILRLSLPVFGDYEITWHTIDGGGGTSTGGPYTLTGTIGQPDAGEMGGGDYQLSGGFWPGALWQQCFVDFEHFARFAMYWLNASCGPGNDWCEGADLDWSTDVGLSDLDELAWWWLAECPTDWPWQ